MKVLIAEDEPSTRAVLAHTVERLGFPVIQASDGQRAWEILLDNPDIGLLVTDMMMPKLDGRSFIERVRKDPHLATMPVLVVSGVISLNQINDLLEQGASRFLPKPIDLMEFRRYVTALMAQPVAEEHVEEGAEA